MKCILSYTGTQHAGSPALVSVVFGKCCMRKHIGEDQPLIGGVTFRLKLPLVQCKMMPFEIGFGKDLVCIKKQQQQKNLLYNFHLVFYNLTMKDF